MPAAAMHPFNSSGPRQRVWISQKAAQAVARVALQARIGNRKLMDAVLEDEQALMKAGRRLLIRFGKSSRANSRAQNPRKTSKSAPRAS